LKIVNERTMVPARFISESLGASVICDGEERLLKFYLEETWGRFFCFAQSDRSPHHTIANVKVTKREQQLLLLC